MDKNIKKLIEDTFHFKTKQEYLFKKHCGITFVFRRDITIIEGRLSSAEIEPVGIIYEENDEFYYAPLHDGDEIDEIVQEYIKKI